MLPELATAPQPTEPAPRTGRVAVAPTTLAPLIVEGNYVSDQAVDPSEGSGVHVPHIGADGEVIEGRKGANRTGRIAVGATDIDAARQEMELQSTYPERSGIPDPHDHPTQPSVEKVTARPDVSLKRSDDSPKPSALHRTLNKTPSAPAATEALSRPIQRAGALGGVYSEDLEIRALQRERRRTVTITISLFLVIGAAGALWWSRGESAEPAPEPTASAEKTADQASTGAAPKKPEAPAEEPTAEEPLENAVAQVADQDTAAEAKTPSEADSEPAEPADSETSESDEQKKAAETARLEAAAAIDEEIDSESLALDENPTSKKKAKKGKKGKSSEGSGSSVKGYESLIRAAKKLRRKQPSKALALYKQALAQRPSSPDALINVGRLQMKSGKTAAAIKTFKRCRKAMPRYTPCMYSHGRALEKAGRRSDAMKAYENYLDVNPDGSQAADVRKRLSR